MYYSGSCASHFTNDLLMGIGLRLLMIDLLPLLPHIIPPPPAACLRVRVFVATFCGPVYRDSIHITPGLPGSLGEVFLSFVISLNERS